MSEARLAPHASRQLASLAQLRLRESKACMCKLKRPTKYSRWLAGYTRTNNLEEQLLDGARSIPLQCQFVPFLAVLLRWDFSRSCWLSWPEASQSAPSFPERRMLAWNWRSKSYIYIIYYNMISMDLTCQWGARVPEVEREGVG